MPRSFLITNKRYKGDGLGRTGEELTTAGEAGQPEELIAEHPWSTAHASPSSAEEESRGPAPTEEDPPSSKEDECDSVAGIPERPLARDNVKLARWRDEISGDYGSRDCSGMVDLSSSPRRPAETSEVEPEPEARSRLEYSSEPVDFSLKSSRCSPTVALSSPHSVASSSSQDMGFGNVLSSTNSPSSDTLPPFAVTPSYDVSPQYGVSPTYDISPTYFPSLFSSVMEERLSGSKTPFDIPPTFSTVPDEMVYKTNFSQLDYRLNALVEKAWGDMSVTDTHVCPECGKRYSTSSNLARHRQTHRSMSDKKARKCPHCDKVYVSMPAYSMHVRTHNQGCECPYCGKRFSRPWLLQGHIRTHTGEKPFTCPQCNKSFADKSNLRAHIQTHSAEKPYVCERCGKAFALKSYLYKHEESSCMRGQHQPRMDRPYPGTGGVRIGVL